MSMYSNYMYDSVGEWLENKYTVGNSKSLKVIQLNMRGMNDVSKFDWIGETLYMSRMRVDVVVLCETWVKVNRKGLFTLDGYSGVFSCRNESHGGLAVFVRDDLKMNVQKVIEMDGFHHIHLRLQLLGRWLEFHAIYRPPAFDCRRFLEQLDQLYSNVRNGNDCIVVGDMNIPVNSPSNPIAAEYLQILAAYNMFVTNTNVTRPTSNNILDHVVCTEHLATTVVNDTIETDISDHCLIVSTFKLSCSIETRSLNKTIVDHRSLNERFSIAVNELPVSMTASDKLLHVVDLYRTILAQCTRTVSVQAKVKGFCPWMTLDVWKLIRIKDKQIKKCKQNPGDNNSRALLEHVSNLLCRKKKQAKHDYYQNILARSSQRDAWKIVNNIRGEKHGRNPNITIHNGDRTLTDMDEICTAFNDHFCHIGRNLASSIPGDRNIHRLGTATAQPTSMYMRPATVNETILLINNLDTKKSCGPDQIAPSFLKNHHQFFALLLTDVFNEIIRTGHYPNCLKVARVVPIFKSGDPKVLANYRPISCLSMLNKIIEKLLVQRINDYVSHFKLLYTHQYGFREGSSTLSAACDLVEDIYDALDNKQIAGALFIDLKKAFDTIDHSILLEKLELLGIRGISKTIIESYLSNRRQYVTIGEHKSGLSSITTGVPQGSNLGPILFLLFINDICMLPLKGKLRLFADDTSVLYQGVSTEVVQDQIKHDILLLEDYFNVNLLSLNLRKTKYMLLHSPNRRLPPRVPLEVHGHAIEEVFEYPFLGLIIDSKMNWSPHINHLKGKISSLCGLLRRISSFIPSNWLLKLYFALIHSRLQYLVAVWGAAGKSRLKELQVSQNRCLKVVFRKPHLFPTAALYNDPNNSILPIRAMYEMQLMVFMNQIVSNTSNIHHNIPLRWVANNRSSRQPGNLFLIRPRTEMGKKKFTYAASKLYNALPPTLIATGNTKCFKRSLRTSIKQNVLRYLV